MRWSAVGVPVRFSLLGLAYFVGVLPCFLALAGVNLGGVRPGGAGVLRVRAVWGLHPGRPCPAVGRGPAPRSTRRPEGGVDPRQRQAGGRCPGPALLAHMDTGQRGVC